MHNKHNKYQGHDRTSQAKYLDAFVHTHTAIRRNLHMAKHATSHVADAFGATYKDRQVFARASGDFASNLSNNDPRIISARLMAQLPDYIHAIQTLPDKRDPNHRARRISKEEREREVAKTISYNNTLRDVINYNPQLQPNTLLKLVSATTMRYGYSDKEREQVIDRTRGDLKGLQHELAFESVLYYLPEGFEIIETTDQDDAHGADYMVRCPNGTIVSIDVKATARLQDEARERKAYWASNNSQTIPNNEIILHSGFEREDFERQNPWRPTHDAIMRVLPDVEAQLLHASGADPHRTKTLVE